MHFYRHGAKQCEEENLATDENQIHAEKIQDYKLNSSV